jgi:hypothetical protein
MPELLSWIVTLLGTLVSNYSKRCGLTLQPTSLLLIPPADNLDTTSRQRACLVNSPGWLEHLRFVRDYDAEQDYKKALNAERREQKRLREQQELAEQNMPPKVQRVTGHGTLCQPGVRPV